MVKRWVRRIDAQPAELRQLLLHKRKQGGLMRQRPLVALMVKCPIVVVSAKRLVKMIRHKC